MDQTPSPPCRHAPRHGEPPAPTGEPPARIGNVATELARDHAALEDLSAALARLPRGSERSATQRELASRFVTHAEVEARLILPILHQFLPSGRYEAQQQERLDRAIARTLAEIEQCDAANCETEPLVDRLRTQLEMHVQRQHIVVLPALIDWCPATELHRLGVLVRAMTRQARAAADDGETAACENAAVRPSGRGMRVLISRITRLGRQERRGRATESREATRRRTAH